MNIKTTRAISDLLRAPNISVSALYSLLGAFQGVQEQAIQNILGPSAGRSEADLIQANLEVAALFAARALDQDEYLLVCDIVLQVLHPVALPQMSETVELLKLRLIHAKALTRLGFTREARQQLETCIGSKQWHQVDPELKTSILLQLGNTLVEEAQNAILRPSRIKTLKEALDFYTRALELQPSGLQPLISKAACLFFLADSQASLLNEAQTMAKTALSFLKTEENATGVKLERTLSGAIAHVITGELEDAKKYFNRLKDLQGATTSFLANARHETRFLAENIGKPQDFFKSDFPPLDLILFAGHLPDAKGAQTRFRLESIDSARDRIAKRLKKVEARVGFASACAGADLLFCEELVKLNGEVHVVLPWALDEFMRTSVIPFEPHNPGPEKAQLIWEPMFKNVIRDAKSIREFGQKHQPSSEVGWRYALEVTCGMAIHAAKVLRLDLRPMALWDTRIGVLPGGTASFVELFENQLHKKVDVIKMPAEIKVRGSAQTSISLRSELQTHHQQVKSILFADIVGYSKLTENVIPEFLATFMRRVSQLVSNSKHAPISINTWGDAVHAVFDYAHDAGCFALELLKLIEDGRKEWLQKGLYWSESQGDNMEAIKHPLNLRIGLHTGPVFVHFDHVLRHLGFTGSHVSRAARIEPIARPGEIYCSEEFAALAELGEAIDTSGGDSTDAGQPLRFTCVYAGTMSLAKHYPGRFRIYRLVPRLQMTVEIAKAIHELYCEQSLARGEDAKNITALQPWDSLPEDLKEANYAQAADIPTKLGLMGYELASSHGVSPLDIVINDEDLEEQAMREHDRWVENRKRNGWVYGSPRDNARKHHPLLVPWEKLSDVERAKDRDTVRNVPKLLARAGFSVRKKQSPL